LTKKNPPTNKSPTHKGTNPKTTKKGRKRMNKKYKIRTIEKERKQNHCKGKERKQNTRMKKLENKITFL